MENKENEVECDGWAVYDPQDNCLIDTIVDSCCIERERGAWFRLLGDNDHTENNMNDLKVQGYTVRPVCFVSPSDKRYLDMRKKIHREALFEQMREETTD